MRFELKLAAALLPMFFWCPPVIIAEEAAPASPARPYLGARLTAEIPDLLRKHLGLEADQGLLVENIYRDGPAEKAGLDKDDILLSVDGTPLNNARAFYRSLRDFGVGGRITLTLIRRGQPTQAVVTLEPMAADFRSNRSNRAMWKYALEPEESVILRPGRMFQMRPGEKEWIEIPMDQLRGGDVRLPHLGAQYHFLHDDGQEEFTIVIEGNPNETDVSVTVKTPDKEYITTGGQIDRLPQVYQQTVQGDLEKAKKSFEANRNLRIPSQFDVSRWQAMAAEDGGRGPVPHAEADGRLAHQIELLAYQIQQIEERQKAIEALLQEKLK